MEISINGFFAVYFGLLFMLIAAIIFWRVRAGTHPKPFLLLSFASLVFVSGVLCFFLQKDWFVRLHWLSKAPVFVLLGMSVTFALLFALVDLLNYCSGQCCVGPTGAAKPVVDTETQVYLVVLAAIAMGALFGLVFGLLDVGDATAGAKVALLRQGSITYPLGAAVAMAAAVGNQYLRERNDKDKGYAFDPLRDDDLDDNDF